MKYVEIKKTFIKKLFHPSHHCSAFRVYLQQLATAKYLRRTDKRNTHKKGEQEKQTAQINQIVSVIFFFFFEEK